MSLRSLLRQWLRWLGEDADRPQPLPVLLSTPAPEPAPTWRSLEELLATPCVEPDRAAFERPDVTTPYEGRFWAYHYPSRGFGRVEPPALFAIAERWLALREQLYGVRP